MTKYTYSKVINKPKLSEEITRSSISSAFDHIDILTGGVSFNVWFKTVLSQEETSTLSTIVSDHSTLGIQEVHIASGLKTDPYTDKLITSDQRFNGPLYVPSCNFKTGLGSNDPSWRPPVSNSVNSFWSIDVSTSGLTKVSYSPSFNYQADGLGYRVFGNVINPSFMQQVILNPHIPSNQGGSYVFSEGRRIVSDDSYERYTDPKYVPKSVTIGETVIPTNIIQFVISHDPSENLSMEVFISNYPQ